MASGRCLISSLVIASGLGALSGGARAIALVQWLLVMYVSVVVFVGVYVLCLGGFILKLSGLSGFVHGAIGRCSGVALSCSFL